MLDLAQLGKLDATRPATWHKEKAGSLSAWTIRLARKVSPKERASLTASCIYFTTRLLRQVGDDERWEPDASTRCDLDDGHRLRFFDKPLPPTFRDALETQYVCDAVLKSAKTRKWEKVKAVAKPKAPAKKAKK